MPDHETMKKEDNNTYKDSDSNKSLDLDSQVLNEADSSPHARQLSNNRARNLVGSSRNRSSRSGQQASRSRKFEFVLVTDDESRRQVRRHAMRQYMHQRRLDSINRLEASRIPIGGWVTRQISESSPCSSSSRSEDVQDENSADEEEETLTSDNGQQNIPNKGTGSSQSLVPKLPEVKHEDSPSLSIVSLKASDPRSSPGEGGLRDPFSSYPIPISHADHELIQHFVVTYPYMMYKFIDSTANNPMMEIFRQFALHDSLPFQAMLAIASKHRAGTEGKTDSVQSLTHKMRALRLMKERMKTDSNGLRDGTIYSVATMAVIEKWSKDASIERMHFKGLASMIRNRGGMRGMRESSPFLEKVLYWVDFSCAPKAIVSTCLPWTGTIPDTVPDRLDFLASELHLPILHYPTTAETSDSPCDKFRACEDFLRFFRRLHQLEKAARHFPINISSNNKSRRVKRFSPGTKLYSILTMLPDYDHGIRDIRFIDEYTCMTCLFFLAVALYDYYLNGSDFDGYLDWLDVEVNQTNPYTAPSITSVLWLFLKSGGYLRNSVGDAGERCWVVSRMVRVAKLLEWKRHGTIWDHLRQVLINFIFTQQECGLGSDAIDEAALAARQQNCSQANEYFWNEGEMRQEILDINSYDMRRNEHIGPCIMASPSNISPLLSTDKIRQYSPL